MSLNEITTKYQQVCVKAVEDTTCRLITRRFVK